MSSDRWMDIEAVARIDNGILLSHKKECIWVRANEVDEPQAYYSEWSKSEIERKKLANSVVEMTCDRG